MNKKKLIVITGPTCVGKTEYAINTALKYNAEIFSADSRQIYLEMTIGTAKPSTSELEKVKHHFINHISVSKQYSVGDYEKEIIEALDEYFLTHEIAILSGGTGLYIDAVINGLDYFPPIDSQIRIDVNSKYKDYGIQALQDELKVSDPEYYTKVDLSNHRRLTRALEVIRQSNKPYTSFLTSASIVRNFETECYILSRDRAVLYDRINTRVDQMIEDGLIEEVKTLSKFKDNTSLQTVGYQEFFDYLDGKISLTRAIELIKQNSRRYAKRQMTWFRKKTDWSIVNLEE